jgi:uncharacterized protein (TIGR02246 family)
LLPLVCQATPEGDIQRVLLTQVEAWNSGDLPAFVTPYSPQCVLVGDGVHRVSRAQVLEHYQSKYPSAEKRGHLTFSGLQVQMTGAQSAVAFGQWHVERAKASGGSVGGVFSVVLQFQSGQWQIILDHTS